MPGLRQVDNKGDGASRHRLHYVYLKGPGSLMADNKHCACREENGKRHRPGKAPNNGCAEDRTTGCENVAENQAENVI